MEGVYKQIELAGRTCYKSEDKITYNSAKKFVDNMVKSKHTAMLEHGTIYLEVPKTIFNSLFGRKPSIVKRYLMNPYSKVEDGYGMCVSPCSNSDNIYKFWAITTNYRVIVENGWMSDLHYQCEPTPYHAKRYTVRFICDRGVSHELVRHRVFSFAQESTRYCNYSKSKFGNELTFIEPSWFAGAEELQQTYFMQNCEQTEQYYQGLLHEGCKPQDARAVLPNALKTEVVMTGFASDWKHFFDLRATGTTGAPHPDMKVLASPLYLDFVSNGML